MLEIISGNSNKKVKDLAALVRSKKDRTKAGLFVLEGERIVRDARATRPELIERIFVSETFAKAHPDEAQDTLVLTDKLFESVSDTVNSQGILAVVRMQPLLRDVKELTESDLILVLEDIRDPGNLGTMIRTAEAAGVGAVIMSEATTDIFSPKVTRSTMGSLLRVPFTYVSNLPGVLKELEATGHEVYAAALEGGTDMREISFPARRAIIIGNEANGISSETLAASKNRVFIPMKGSVESLNAAVAAAVLMFR